MPTTYSRRFIATGLLPFIYQDQAKELAVALAPSQNLPRGTIVGELTAEPGQYAEYDNSNSDGTQVAKGILKYDVSVDADGNIAYVNSASGLSAGEHGETFTDTPIYVEGYFATSELSGLDSAAVTDLGRLIQGTTSEGILKVS